VNCEILETIYVRSNGDIPCDDDAGETVLLGTVELTAGWSISRVLDNDLYRGIRAALSDGRAPFDECQRCAWLRPHQNTTDQLRQRRVMKVQVETSLRCQLQCPGCSNGRQSKERERPHLMDVELFEQLLRSLSAEGYHVGEIEYCGQGEPLLHPHFSEFVALSRRYFASALQRVITNANVDYAQSTGRQGIDEIIVSCDGARQDTYEKYRLKGDIQLALDFIRDAPTLEGGRHQRLVWKYIVFEWNDSDEEICAAQHLAQELGVDTLMFVFTHSEGRSLRWTTDNVANFPILFPNVMTSATPVHERAAVASLALGSWLRAGDWRRRIHFCVDRVALDTNSLDIRGWMWISAGVDQIVVSVDGRRVGALPVTQRRPDVADQYPDFGNVTGFSGRLALGPMPSGTYVLELEVWPWRGPAVTLRRNYTTRASQRVPVTLRATSFEAAA
jgi:organic radical activating enzyme